MHDHIGWAATAFSASFSALIGYLFDVPPTVIWAAAIGSAFGVALGRPVGAISGFLWILGGTITASYCVPIIAIAWPAVYIKGAAFLLTLLLIGFRYQILGEVPGLIAAGFAAGKDWIGRLSKISIKFGGDDK